MHVQSVGRSTKFVRLEPSFLSEFRAVNHGDQRQSCVNQYRITHLPAFLCISLHHQGASVAQSPLSIPARNPWDAPGRYLWRHHECPLRTKAQHCDHLVFLRVSMFSDSNASGGVPIEHNVVKANTQDVRDEVLDVLE